MKIAMISTWKVPCGVGKYCEELCNELSKFVELKIFAEKTDKELEPIDPKSNIVYERCYTRGKSYDELLQKLIEYKPDIVHTQFESSMFQESYTRSGAFLKFLNVLHENKIKTCLTFHNILPFDAPFQQRDEILFWYNNLNSVVILGNEAVKTEFSKWNPTARATTIVLGSTIFDAYERSVALSKLSLPNKIYIVQPGFYGADKGMIQLVKLMPKILEMCPSAHLVFAGGLHPQCPIEWKVHTRECIKEVIQNNLTKNVTILGRFVPEDELNLWLGASSIIMLNYHWVSGLYSTSASGHRVLCANRPIIMNSQDVRLSEFQDAVHCCKSDDNHLLDSIIKCLTDKEYSKKISEGALNYAQETRFENIAKKHLEFYGGI